MTGQELGDLVGVPRPVLAPPAPRPPPPAKAAAQMFLHEIYTRGEARGADVSGERPVPGWRRPLLRVPAAHAPARPPEPAQPPAAPGWGAGASGPRPGGSLLASGPDAGRWPPRSPSTSVSSLLPLFFQREQPMGRLATWSWPTGQAGPDLGSLRKQAVFLGQISKSTEFMEVGRREFASLGMELLATGCPRRRSPHPEARPRCPGPGAAAPPPRPAP